MVAECFVLAMRTAIHLIFIMQTPKVSRRTPKASPTQQKSADLHRAGSNGASAHLNQQKQAKKRREN